MNSVLLARTREVEAKVRSRLNEAIRIEWAPKIQRFVLCEERLDTGADPTWIPRDSDLEGAEYEGPWGTQPINAMTTLRTLVRMETMEGDYMEPTYAIVELVYGTMFKRRGDVDPTEYGSRAAARREAAFEKEMRDDWKAFEPTYRAKQVNRIYSTPR